MVPIKCCFHNVRTRFDGGVGTSLLHLVREVCICRTLLPMDTLSIEASMGICLVRNDVLYEEMKIMILYIIRTLLVFPFLSI